MGQPVVLPKFELAGDKPHWSVRLAWGTGAVLLASMLGLGAVIIHRQGLERDLQTAKAEADRKVAAVIATERAAREADLAAKQAARTVAANTVTAAAESDEARSAKAMTKASTQASSRGSHSRHGRANLAARAASSGKPTAAPSEGIVDKSGPKSGGKRADVIDELMAKMK